MIDCVMVSVPPLGLTGPHIGPAILKAYAEREGYSVTCVNPSLDFWEIMRDEEKESWPHTEFDKGFESHYNITEIIDKWTDEWLALEPRVIGLSTHVWASEYWLGRICEILRLKTDKVICMGGPAAIELGDTALEKDWIDYHVVGDGEKAFINILEGKCDHPSINTNKPHSITQEEFDNLPVPDYSDIDFERFRKAYPKQNRVFLIGTRGCVYDCSFCNVPALMKYRFKDGKKFANEIKTIQKQFKPTHIEFADSLINGSLSQYRSLINELSKLNQEDPEDIPSITAFYRIRPFKNSKEEDFRLMKEAGFFRLKIGVESGSKEVRDHIGKTETEEEILWTFEMCKKYGLHINLLIIVGYPTETRADFLKTMNMLEMIKDKNYDGVVDRIVVNELYLSSDTGLMKQVSDLDIQDAESGTKWFRTLPNGEVLDNDERQRRLDVAIDYIKENFSGSIMVFTDSKKSNEVLK